MNAQHYDPEKLTNLRERVGLSRQEVADKLHIDRQTVRRAESGIVASYDLLCDLCDLYGVQVITLLYPHRIAA